MAIHPLFAPLLPLLAAVPVLTGQDGGQQASETDVIATNDDRHARMTVPVRMGAHGPFNFLIDTGSQNTAISTRVAERMALKPSSRAKLIGVVGTEMVDMVELDEIALGRRSFYGILAPLLEYNNIGADGILGIDSLQDQRVLIDFRRELIAVNDAKTLGGNRGFEIVVTARRRSGQLIMTDAVLDGVRVEIVIDTGAETSIGNRALQLAMRRRHSPQGTVELHSVTGQRMTAELGLGRSMKIDDITFRNVLVAYVDSPAFAALDLNAKPALFLGMRDLRGFDRVAIDFATRKIFFDVPKGAMDGRAQSWSGPVSRPR
jgi:predicted aspartyl protease